MSGSAGLSLGMLFVALFGVIVAILWIFVPFLIMGTNKRLDRLIEQNAMLLKRGGIDPNVTDTSRPNVREYASALGSLFTGKDD
jgi:hypothetical protein